MYGTNEIMMMPSDHDNRKVTGETNDDLDTIARGKGGRAALTGQVLKMRRRRDSVTMRVRQSGHSRELSMMSSEQPRHMARWLNRKDRDG
jgi:hypothetical protein